VTYTIQAGDTLSKIAARFRTSVARLASDNQIDDPNVIQIGDVLEINSGSPPAVTLNQAGNIVDALPGSAANPDLLPTLDSVGTAFNWQDWLKPPRVYFVLGALAVGVYLITDKRRR